mmetsp:Transcript_81585/g.205287  ORF Transcript_81585/g.205287 Transcript_81585/m.205287 type:complete len:204 (-) Transcript_81585:632-1243(-)
MRQGVLPMLQTVVRCVLRWLRHNIAGSAEPNTEIWEGRLGGLFPCHEEVDAVDASRWRVRWPYRGYSSGLRLLPRTVSCMPLCDELRDFDRALSKARPRPPGTASGPQDLPLGLRGRLGLLLGLRVRRQALSRAAAPPRRRRRAAQRLASDSEPEEEPEPPSESERKVLRSTRRAWRTRSSLAECPVKVTKFIAERHARNGAR